MSARMMATFSGMTADYSDKGLLLRRIGEELSRRAGYFRRLFALGAVLGQPGLDDLAHQGGGQRLIRWEADGALTGVGALELGREGVHGMAGHRVKGAVRASRAQCHQRP